MAIEEQHVALPKLYGAPAYARPALRVVESPRPFDPDDLPLDALQTSEEKSFVASLPAHAYVPGGVTPREPRSDGEPRLHPRPLSLRALAGRVLGTST